MRVQSVMTSKPRIRPIILANGRQRRLWPLSTPQTPFCLRSIGGRTPHLVRILQGLDATPAFGAPIVILGSAAARSGIAEVTRLRPDATIILVPEDLGSGIPALLGATHVLDNSKEELIALIPASFTAADPVDAFRSLATIAAQLSQIDQTILMATRVAQQDGSMRLELGHRVAGTSLYSVKQIFETDQLDIASALGEMRALVSMCGPVLVSPKSIHKHVQKNFPTTFVACHNAMQLAEKFGNTIRPQADFLSFAGRHHLHDYFRSILSSLEIYIGNPDWRTIETFRDPLFDDVSTKPMMPVGVAGYNGSRIISSDDGILILKKGYEDDVKDHYPSADPLNNLDTVVRMKGPHLRFNS